MCAQDPSPGQHPQLTPDWERIHQRAEALEHVLSDSKYERQKDNLRQSFQSFLAACTPPATLYDCRPPHVRDFLIWKEQRGHTALHSQSCTLRGRPGNQPCTCPRTTSAGTVDSVLGQLRAILRDIGRGTEWYTAFDNGNPAASHQLKRHLKAVRKERAAALAHPKQAIPLLLDKVAKLHRHLSYKLLNRKLQPAHRYLLLRDRAYLKLIAFTGDRGADLGLVQTEQLNIADNTLSIKALVGKSFSETTPRLLLFDRSDNPELCLVSEMQAYLTGAESCGISLKGGYLFRTCARGGATITPSPATSSAMTTRLKKHLQTIGAWDGETSHSARVGCSVALILLGATPNDVKAHIGWQSDQMVQRYTRRASAYREDGTTNTLTSRGTSTETLAMMGRFRKRLANAEQHQ